MYSYLVTYYINCGIYCLPINSPTTTDASCCDISEVCILNIKFFYKNLSEQRFRLFPINVCFTNMAHSTKLTIIFFCENKIF